MPGPNEQKLQRLASGEDWDIVGLAKLTGRAKELKQNLDSLISSLDGKWEGEAASAALATLRRQSEIAGEFANLSDKTLGDVTGMSTTYCAAGGGANGIRREQAEAHLASLPAGEIPRWVHVAVAAGSPVLYLGLEVTPENGLLSRLSQSAADKREQQAGAALEKMGVVINGLSSEVNQSRVAYDNLFRESEKTRPHSVGPDPEIKEFTFDTDPSSGGWSGDLPGSGFATGGSTGGWAGGTSVGGTGAGAGGVGAGIGGISTAAGAGAGIGAGYVSGVGSGTGSYSSGTIPGMGSNPGGTGKYSHPDYDSSRGYVDGGGLSGGGRGGGYYSGDYPGYENSTGVDSNSSGVTSSPGHGILAGGGSGAALAAGSAGLKGTTGSGGGALGALFGRAGGVGAGMAPGGVPGIGGVGGAGAGPGGVGTGGVSGAGLGGGKGGGLAGGVGPTSGGGAGSASSGSASSAGGARPAGMMAGGMGGHGSKSKSQRRGLGLAAPKLEDTPEGGPASDVSRAGRRAGDDELVPGEHDFLGEF